MWCTPPGLLMWALVFCSRSFLRACSTLWTQSHSVSTSYRGQFQNSGPHSITSKTHCKVFEPIKCVSSMGNYKCEEECDNFYWIIIVTPTWSVTRIGQTRVLLQPSLWAASRLKVKLFWQFLLFLPFFPFSRRVLILGPKKSKTSLWIGFRL